MRSLEISNFLRDQLEIKKSSYLNYQFGLGHLFTSVDLSRVNLLTLSDLIHGKLTDGNQLRAFDFSDYLLLQGHLIDSPLIISVSGQ
jgi:hypothetical protein